MIRDITLWVCLLIVWFILTIAKMFNDDDYNFCSKFEKNKLPQIIRSQERYNKMEVFIVTAIIAEGILILLQLPY